MRITKLYIKKYKNIVRQEFDFSKSSERYIALIGLNGSGKSNLLEAISQIICKLLSIPSIQNVDGYRLEYTIDGTNYVYGNINSQFENEEIPEPNLKPSDLIACYSGEDDRLWHMAFESYHSFYLGNAIRQNYHIPKDLYIDKHCWKIALISLLCASEDEINVSDFLESCLGINDISTVTISFSHDGNKLKTFKNHDALNWFNRIINNLDDNNEINARTLSTMEVSSSSLLVQKQKKSKIIFQYLYILSQSKQNKSNKVDKLITDISIKINDINFEDLSEGEKKLILIECITKVLGNSNSLVLLDEPDAHTHIARKKDLLKAIQSFEGQILFTTHSPMFVSQMSENNIFPIVNGKLLTQDKRDLIQKIANNEINIIDGACIVSSKYVLITEGPDDIFHIKSAISVFSSKDPKYKPLEKVSFIFMGGAKEVENYYNEVLKSLCDSVNKMVFTFDYDGEGREGAKMVQKLIEKDFNKFQYVFYHKTYPVPDPKLDFYLEDFFDKSSYRDVELPIINGTPSYAELKKSSTWAESIKKAIRKHKRNQSLGGNDYNGFQNFLDQLITSFGF